MSDTVEIIVQSSDTVEIGITAADTVEINLIDTLIVGNQNNAFPYILPFNLE